MLSAFTAKAQSEYSLSFGYYDPIISDTAYMDGVLGISASIKNTGQDTIFWPLHLMYAANSDVGVVEGDILSADEDFFLAPSDSIYIGWPNIDTVTSIFVGGYIAVNEQKGFYDGDNIIVVWPAVFDSFLDEGTTLTVEQYMQEVYVIDNTSGKKTHLSQA